MKMKYVLTLNLVLGVLFCSSQLHAQNFYKEKASREMHVQAGIGPSFMYADNAGGLRGINFNIRPSLSASIAKSIHPFINMRGTLGYQFYKGQSADYFHPSYLDMWKANNESASTTSNIVFMDVMPLAHVNRVTNHTTRGSVDFYGGAGLGFLMAFNKETKLRDTGSFVENKTRPAVYIPIRAGFSFKLDLYSDIAVEGTLMLGFSDNIDGATNYNEYNDHLIQGQIVYRRYLSPVRGIN